MFLVNQIRFVRWEAQRRKEKTERGTKNLLEPPKTPKTPKLQSAFSVISVSSVVPKMETWKRQETAFPSLPLPLSTSSRFSVSPVLRFNRCATMCT